MDLFTNITSPISRDRRLRVKHPVQPEEGGSNPARSLQFISPSEANHILDRGGHYLGAAGYQPYYCITTPNRDALAVIAPPVSWQFRARKIGWKKPLELSRLWRADDSPIILSQFVGSVLRWLRDVSEGSECIFSYADPDTVRKHRGVIYQATNWRYLGTSRAIDYCLDKHGNEIPLTVCYRKWRTKSREHLTSRKIFKGNWGTTTKPDWRDVKGPGLKWVEGAPKHLYMFPLRMSADEVLKMLAKTKSRYNEFKPYPK